MKLAGQRIDHVAFPLGGLGATDDSCLPVAALEYPITNRSTKPVKAVFSFHAANWRFRVCGGIVC